MWNNIHVFPFCSRVQFNDSRFEFHDSSWSFHKSIFSRKHTFHKSIRANRTQDYGLNTSKQVQNYSTLLEFWKHSYGWFPSSSNSLSSKGDVSFRKIIIVCETKYLNKLRHFAKCLAKSFLMQNNFKKIIRIEMCFCVNYYFIIKIPG